LNEGQIPNPNVVRVAVGARYHRVEGNRRASRNGPVSDLPPETPTATIRSFFIAVGGGRGVQVGEMRDALAAVLTAAGRHLEVCGTQPVDVKEPVETPWWV
jgi:hypothetical protein